MLCTSGPCLSQDWGFGSGSKLPNLLQRGHASQSLAGWLRCFVLLSFFSFFFLLLQSQFENNVFMCIFYFADTVALAAAYVQRFTCCFKFQALGQVYMDQALSNQTKLLQLIKKSNDLDLGSDTGPTHPGFLCECKTVRLILVTNVVILSLYFRIYTHSSVLCGCYQYSKASVMCFLNCSYCGGSDVS